MKQIVIIQPSLRQQSYTAILCNIFIQGCLDRKDVEVKLIDLRERHLEFCDGREIFEYNTDIQSDYEAVKYADIVIFWFPLYHFSVSWVLKNYIDIMRDALQDKKIDFLVSAIFKWWECWYEHILDSLHMKYNVTKAGKNTPYVLNEMFQWEILIDSKIEKEIHDFALSL